MPLKIEFELPNELVDEIIKCTMDSYPEAGRGMSIQCEKWNYRLLKFTFADYDDPNRQGNPKRYKIGKDELLKALKLVFTDAWPHGLPKPPANADKKAWDDWMGECDNTSHDAFIQLACLGEVRYG